VPSLLAIRCTLRPGQQANPEEPGELILSQLYWNAYYIQSLRLWSVWPQETADEEIPDDGERVPPVLLREFAYMADVVA
jgi:hypothetical protein